VKYNVQAALALLVCTLCIARLSASQQPTELHDVGHGPYVTVDWAELTLRNDGWNITSTHEVGGWNSTVRPGDLVLEIDGVDVSHLNPLSVASLLEDTYFRDVTIAVERQGRTEQVNVRVGQSQPDEYTRQFYQRFGIGASIITPKEPPAVKFEEVVPGGPADRAGLKEGDELVAVDGREVAGLNGRDIVEMVSSTHPGAVELLIRRGTEALKFRVNRLPLGQLYKPVQQAKVAFPMQTGVEAPMFKLEDPKGHSVSLEDFRGKWVLLTFWATWCVPCQKEVPVLNKLTHDYSAQLAILALDVDDKREDLERFIASNTVSYRVLMAGKSDDQVGKSYNVRGVPVNVIVTPEERSATFK
jgi:peroxiredoxin